MIPSSPLVDADWQRLRAAARGMEDLDAFVKVVAAGLTELNVPKFLEETERAVLQMNDRLRAAGRVPVDDNPAMRERATRLIKDFTEKEVTDGHPYLFRFSIIRLWSILDEYVSGTLADFARYLIASGDPKLKPQLRKIKVPAAQFWLASEEERSGIFIKQLQVEREVGGKHGIDKFEALLEVFDLKENVPNEISMAILALSESRNCIVHHSGCAGRNLLDRCEWLGAKFGEPLTIKWNQYRTYSAAASWYLFEIARRLLAKHPKIASDSDFGREVAELAGTIGIYRHEVRHGLWSSGVEVPGFDPEAE